MDSNIETLDALLRNTETNISRIQAVGNVFVTPVLNEWRYATRHIVKLLTKAHDEDWRRNLEAAIRHMHKAYFNSCKILLDVYLMNAQALFDRYHDIANLILIKKGMQGYWDVFIDGKNLARSISEETKLDDNIQEKLENILARFENMFKLVNESRMEFEYEKRLMKRRYIERWLSLIVSILSVMITVVVLLWKLL